MPFFRTSSGVIYEVDTPKEGTVARDRHDEQVAKGELTPVAGTPRKVEQPGGGFHWELDAPEPPVPAPVAVELDAEAAPESESEPESEDDTVPDGTIDEVLEWVNDDPDRARQARDVEDSEDGKNRRSLIAELDSIIGS